MKRDKRKWWHYLRAANERRRRISRGRQSPAAGPVASPATKSLAPTPSEKASRPQSIIRRGTRRRLFRFLQPPADFSLRTNFDAVAAFLEHLRHDAYRDRSKGMLPVAIDFGALKSISPAAALVLAAELFRWQRFIKRRLNASRQHEWHPEVAYMLESMGLFDFLRTPNVRQGPERPPEADIRVLKYRMDTDVVGTKCDDLLEHLTEVSGEINAQNFIYDGLIEALKNSKQHAYSDAEQWFGVEPGTWFMSGSYDRDKKVLTAAVFDLGIGIPRTLPRSGFWEAIRPAFQLGTSDDAKMIEAAMEVGRSRIDLPGRGNGLSTMMRILDHHAGYLRIISGTGEANYDSAAKRVATQNHQVSLGGTLIEWSIKR